MLCGGLLSRTSVAPVLACVCPGSAYPTMPRPPQVHSPTDQSPDWLDCFAGERVSNGKEALFMRLLALLFAATAVFAQDPVDFQGWLEHGVQEFRQARYPQAVEAFERATAIDP